MFLINNDANNTTLREGEKCYAAVTLLLTLRNEIRHRQGVWCISMEGWMPSSSRDMYLDMPLHRTGHFFCFYGAEFFSSE